MCAPYLKNTTTYYLADETVVLEWDHFGPSPMYEYQSVLNVMSQECSANVMELVCHSFFKECKAVEVEDPFMGSTSVMLPSLLCKEECERHKTMWDECVAKIGKNADDKQLFDESMGTMADVVANLLQEHKLITRLDIIQTNTL